MKKRQAHRDIPQGCFEEEQGQGGFYGPVSHLIREKPPTRWIDIKGALKPRMYDLNSWMKKPECWKQLLYNECLRIHFFQQSRVTETAYRGANGDLLFFCHRGKGVLLSEYGLLNYAAGQYILIPKCLSHAFVPESSSCFLVIESLKGHFREPDRGLLGRNALYDSTAKVRPDLASLHRFLKKQGLKFKQILVFHEEESTCFSYKDCVFSDVREWKGDLFPFRLSMNDIMPVMSHRAHLPPSAHSTFLTDDFIVCSFLPRPLEQDKTALKVPFYHQNTDYDEVIFYHKGGFFSREDLKPGMLSFHPAGFPHGPHPKAVKNIESKSHTDEYAVMLDSRQRLKASKDLSSIELSSYWKSWQT